MGWANSHIEKLQAGEPVSFRPKGNSMQGKIESGQLCTLEPISGEIKVGDVVLCKVGGRQLLHLVSAVQGKRYQISNNKKHINGWISIDAIFGKLTKVEK